MTEQRKTPYVPPNPTKDYNLRVKGNFLEGGTRPTELSFEIWNGRPRVVAYSNKEGEFKENVITAGFNHYDWNGFLDQLLAVADGNSEGFLLDNMGFAENEGGERSREMVPQSRIRVGRDENGVITLSVGAGVDKFKADFKIVPDGFHRFMKLDKTPYTEQEASEMAVRNVVATWRPIMAVLASMPKNDKGDPVMGSVSTTGASSGGQEKKPWNNNNNQGGGGYQKKPWNNNQGGGGNYQKKQWNNNNQGGGGYQKKWNNNQGGGGNYQKKQWNNNNQGGGGGYQKKSWGNNNQGGGNDSWDDVPM